MNSLPCPPHIPQSIWVKSAQLTIRHARVLAALLDAARSREQIDRIAGASNGPHYIQGLRKLGLVIHCYRRVIRDADGRTCRPGLYILDPDSRPQATQLLCAIHARGGA
jgi:hypothetical protein